MAAGIVRIGSREVGQDRACYVIAEAGSNHNRDLDMARRLIDVAHEAGADAVKFQTFSGGRLYAGRAPSFDYLGMEAQKAPADLLRELELPRDWQPLLAQHARDRGIEFLSTPFDTEAVDELVAIGVAALKVASFELVDLPFIRYIGQQSLPVIMSTGMATLGEIEEALDAGREGGADQFCLMQCASVYPAPASTMNLRSIATMKMAFQMPVGLSDHTLGTHVAPAAIALGADLVEKHFTLDHTLPGPDHSFAVEPDGLRRLVAQIRDVEEALGDGVKHGPTDAEAVEMYQKGRRSVVAAKAIPAGTRIAPDMLTVKRPGFGVKPKLIPTIVGRVATVDIPEDEVITWEML